MVNINSFLIRKMIITSRNYFYMQQFEKVAKKFVNIIKWKKLTDLFEIID
jgi:hypothetical protein